MEVGELAAKIKNYAIIIITFSTLKSCGQRFKDTLCHFTLLEDIASEARYDEQYLTLDTWAAPVCT